jgi:Flp pilus assembly protein TadG
MTVQHAFSRLASRVGGFVRDQSGMASAVEFAMILPLMITFYLGGVELSQGIAVDRKVTLAARAVADLTAQATSVNSTDILNILEASSAVVAPWPQDKLKVKVSQVKIDAAGSAKVQWGEAKNTSARGVNEAVTLPAALKIPNTWLIWGEVQYDYTPVIGYVVTGTLQLKDHIYMRPRLSDCVVRTTACN